jgi:hypothetical protein
MTIDSSVQSQHLPTSFAWISRRDLLRQVQAFEFLNASNRQ